MLAVAYANPVFAQLEANNGANSRTTATHKSHWVPQFAKPPAPKPGTPIRFGSYNVMLYPTGTRAGVVARNIGSHGVTMVALQEARQTTASTVVNYLNKLYPGTWDYVRASGATTATPGQQIVYRKDKFTLTRSGVMNMYNSKDPSNRVIAPWAAFHGSNGKTFYVASEHFAGEEHSSWSQNAKTGQAALLVSNYMKNLTSSPVIVAGDLRYGREPWGEKAGYVPAQPTFVRNGYYDAMASQSMHNYNYSVVNSVGGHPSAHQRPNPSGLGARSDDILLRGFTGSKDYMNVVNWSYKGSVPSDHNLIYSDIMIPN
jgi:endonuclease/exonuclease/phosphatase family metal-dependent hydrolase